MSLIFVSKRFDFDCLCHPCVAEVPGIRVSWKTPFFQSTGRDAYWMFAKNGNHICLSKIPEVPQLEWLSDGNEMKVKSQSHIECERNELSIMVMWSACCALRSHQFIFPAHRPLWWFKNPVFQKVIGSYVRNWLHNLLTFVSDFV